MKKRPSICKRQRRGAREQGFPLGRILICLFVTVLIIFMSQHGEVLLLAGKSSTSSVGVGLYQQGPFNRKDKVFFKSTQLAKTLWGDVGKEREFAKEIQGIAGDQVVVLDEVVQILRQGQMIWEGRIQEGKFAPIQDVIIPDGHYFVAGENDHSIDSRYEVLGLVPETQIKGRWWALW